MAKKRKQTKSRTPSRRSSRKRQRTAKGDYYDEYVLQCTTSADESMDCDKTTVVTANVPNVVTADVSATPVVVCCEIETPLANFNEQCLAVVSAGCERANLI